MRGKQKFGIVEVRAELAQTLLSKGERTFRVTCFKKIIRRQQS
jgi:hypothetical protein